MYPVSLITRRICFLFHEKILKTLGCRLAFVGQQFAVYCSNFRDTYYSLLPPTLKHDFTNITVFPGLIKRVSVNRFLKMNPFLITTFFQDYDKIIISAFFSCGIGVRSRGSRVQFGNSKLGLYRESTLDAQQRQFFLVDASSDASDKYIQFPYIL